MLHMSPSQNNAKTLGVILAAGKGTRMKSDRPKVLHPVLGVPIVERVMAALETAGVAETCLILGGDLEQFKSLRKRHPHLAMVQQINQCGTGDAVATVATLLPGITPPHYMAAQRIAGPNQLDATHVLICCGDTPALDGQLLKEFVSSCLSQEAPLGLIGIQLPNPTGYGRLVLDATSQLVKIVEEKDADAATRGINICNSGIIFGKIDVLFSLLAALRPLNAQKEYYLTDCFSLAREKGLPVHVMVSPQYQTFEGVNDRTQLTRIETWLLEQRIGKLMAGGVTIHQPLTVYLEDSVTVEPDVEIFPNVVLQGKTHIGKGSIIGANSVLTNVRVSPGTPVKPGSVVSDQDLPAK